MDVAEAFIDLPGLAVLESARPGRRSRWTFLSADPLAVLERPTPGIEPFAEARALLARMDGGVPAPHGPSSTATGSRSTPVPEAGRSDADPPFTGGLVGYLGYDLGRAFEPIPMLVPDDQGLPDMRLALHDWVVAWDRRTGAAWLGGRAVDGDIARLHRRLGDVRRRLSGVASGTQPHAPSADVGGLAFRSSLDRSAYEAGVEDVREAIARGEIYQANLTRRLAAPFEGDPWAVYRRVRTGDPALYAAFLDLGPAPGSAGSTGSAGSAGADVAAPSGGPAGSAPHRALVSASPEPFLAVDRDGLVVTDPIKGTRPRGRDRAEDRALAAELLASAKDRAENVMIVDVLRNDLGRVCRPGSVCVPRLCRLERTATVQHLVSTVTGSLATGRDQFDLLAAAFPGGSITGAPKIRAMQILETLEPVRRGPYTGALGWIGPDGAMATSILIRTFVADGHRLTLHVGGGITRRSVAAEEWLETVAKAAGPLGAIGANEAVADVIPADIRNGARPAGSPAEAPQAAGTAAIGVPGGTRRGA